MAKVNQISQSSSKNSAATKQIKKKVKTATI